MVDTPYALGALPPIEHPTAWRWHQHPLAAATRPMSFDGLTGAPIAVKDQRQTGSCVGQSTSELIEVLHVLAEAVGGVLSAEMVWQLAKQMENSLGGNVGVYPHDALTCIRGVGICADTLMPLSETDFNELPSAAALADAKPRAGITFRQCGNREELLTAMGSLGVPGLVAIAVYPPFFNPNPDGTVGPLTGAIAGYHALVARGYDDAARTVRIRNSWGSGWGNAGDCILSYDQLDLCLTEAWIVEPLAKPQPNPTPTWQPDPQVQAFLAWQTAAVRWCVAAYAAARSASDAAAVVAEERVIEQTTVNWFPFLSGRYKHAPKTPLPEVPSL